MVVVCGCDKSSNDTGLAARIANQHKGNSSKYVQLLGAHEDASECYFNLRDTFFSDDCPLKEYLQYLVNDWYQLLVVKVGDECQCFTFAPFPRKKRCKTRKFDAVLHAEPLCLPSAQSSDDDDEDGEETIDEEIDVFDDEPDNGVPPKIALDRDEVEVCLIFEGKRSIVGFRFLSGGDVVCTHRFSYPIELKEDLADLSSVEVFISQMNGHVANDYKQALIEVGICSPSATCSCVVCMRKKSQFQGFH